jgi:hypothetical protein
MMWPMPDLSEFEHFPVDGNGWAQMNIRLRPELRASVDAFCEEMGWPRHVFVAMALFVLRQIREEARERGEKR